MALRVLMFPMANKSCKSFAKLRQISPQMTEMRQKYGHDKPKLQQEIMKLYEREKVNPMAGCLPILIQIPVFFSLYKVLSITIEMRHAPFFGWIQDLSAPDPTNIFTLFGLIDWNVPSFLHIGAWPLVMMVTLILQQRLNPKSQDPSQAQAMAMMPYFMTYLLSNFAAGLVIYWSVSNLLSSLQQYVIMRSMGVKVSLWGRDEDADKKVEKQ
jgi:YidC/Oxa1 family membrane protein insertase